jgi:uncharacterized protein YndB with AHSA1/START domain
MRPVDLSISIARPCEEVFEYLTDYSHEAEWQGEHVLESRPEPSGPVRLGTKVHKVRKTPLGTQRFTVEIVSYDDRGMTWTDRIVTGPLTGTTGRWTVSDATEGCGVTVRMTFTGKTYGKLIAPVARRSAARSVASELRNLRRLMEGRS